MEPSAHSWTQGTAMTPLEQTSSVSVNNDELSHEVDPRFFSVSIMKLVVLSICTLGLYDVYWFYKHWQLVKKHERSGINPFWRTLFAGLFCYALFRRVMKGVGDQELLTWTPAPLAVAWIVTNLMWKLPDPYWLISLLAFLFLIPVQVVANRVNRQHSPTLVPDNTFGVWNIVTVVVGGILLVLGVVGTFLPKE